ncbi:hypothetical protein OAS76_00425 [Nitrosopumilus sp.]|nr:hypothetical protein [Nitrosopumilus sp.]
MLKNKNAINIKSEPLMYLPNVNSLMKISLGLIFFTMLSTVLVYAETSFDVPYTATGLNVIGIESDNESVSLIFSVNVTDLDSKLSVVLDRSFFDSVYNKLPIDYIVLADGDYALFEEIEINSLSRTLNITVPSGTEELEILGSILDDSFPIVLVDTNETSYFKTAADKAAADKAAADKAAADKAAQTQCGPGTILQNDSCVLDERCGPGTSLEDGVCVLDSVPVTSSSSGSSKDLIMGVTIAFVIAGVIGILLALVARANRNKN